MSTCPLRWIGRCTRRRWAWVGGVLRTLTIGWSGAEDLVRFLYRHVLRYLFTWVGLILAALVTVVGVAALGTVISRHAYGIQNRHFGIVFAILMTLDLIIIFVHEMGHASVEKPLLPSPST